MTFGGNSNKGPSIAELQRFVRDQTTLRFMLANGDKVVGKLKWADENAFKILPDGQEAFTILRSAVLGYQVHDGQAVAARSSASQSAPAEKKAAAATADSSAEAQPEPALEVRADDIGS